MYKKSEANKQLDLFSSPFSQLSKRSTKILQQSSAWYNLFHKEVIQNIDESIFKPLYSQRNGRPNAPIRVMIGMMILKEANGWSDKQLFEQARFNLLVRTALGLFNLDEDPPVESTYYDFRRALASYYDKTKEDLMDKVFKQITAAQLKAFNMDGEVVRMDSKLINSNISRAQRLELVVETIRKFIRTVPDETMKVHLDNDAYELLAKLKKRTTENFVYGLTVQGKKDMLKKMGMIMGQLVRIYRDNPPAHYDILKRVYEEQFIEVKIDKPNEKDDEQNIPGNASDTEATAAKERTAEEEVQNTATSKEIKEQDKSQHIEDKLVAVPREPQDIPSSSIQSPHDTEATYRRKGHGKIKQDVHGFHSNVTEVVNKEKSLRFITDVQTLPAHISEDKFLPDAVFDTLKLLQEAYGDKASIKKILTDGGYDSKANRELFSREDMPSWRISKNKGTPLMYHMRWDKEGRLEVWLRSTGERVETYYSDKAGKYVIKVPGRRPRYMTREAVEAYIRKEYMIGLDDKEAGLRANMESTIYQLFHRLGKNNKVRYRGLIRIHWYVLFRAVWVNLQRMVARFNRSCYFGNTHPFSVVLEALLILLSGLILFSSSLKRLQKSRTGKIYASPI